MTYLHYPLELFKKNKRNTEIRKILKKATNQLLTLINNWKHYKPIRGYIEDFFKVSNKHSTCTKYTNIQSIHSQKTYIYVYY